MKKMGDRIRDRAFELFQRRGRGDGFALEDWLKAEKDLIWTPESDLVEKEWKFEVKMAVPGFDAKDIHIAATSGALFVNADTTSHKHEKEDGNVHFCEFGKRELFRRFDLPEPIDVDKVTAKLDKGVLHLVAAKKEQAAETQVAA
jgi:HSP20 family protein